jgi:hypothetical protein
MRQSWMTEHLCILASSLLALLVLSACSPQGARTPVVSEPQSSAGITVFGDARLGVIFD